MLSKFLQKIISLLPICPACNKHRIYIKRRTFYSKVLHTRITSNNPICNKCLGLYKNIKQHE